MPKINSNPHTHITPPPYGIDKDQAALRGDHEAFVAIEIEDQRAGTKAKTQLVRPGTVIGQLRTYGDDKPFETMQKLTARDSSPRIFSLKQPLPEARRSRRNTPMITLAEYLKGIAPEVPTTQRKLNRQINAAKNTVLTDVEHVQGPTPGDSGEFSVN